MATQYQYQKRKMDRKTVGEFATGFFAGIGGIVLLKYLEGGSSVLRTRLAQIGPNAWVGYDDLIIGAAEPLTFVAFKKYAGAAGSLLGILTDKALEAVGGGVSPITNAPFSLSPVTGVPAGVISKDITVPGSSFYQQPRLPGMSATAAPGPKNFF